MTIYLALHLLYFITHTQCFFLSMSDDDSWWIYVLLWLFQEVVGHLTIWYINQSLKKHADREKPVPCQTTGTAEAEQKMKRCISQLLDINRLMGEKISLLEQEKRELETRLQAIQNPPAQGGNTGV